VGGAFLWAATMQRGVVQHSRLSVALAQYLLSLQGFACPHSNCG